MKTAAVLLLIVLSGCATSKERCMGYGFKLGTPELAMCSMNEDQMRRQNALNTLNQGLDRQQRSYDSFLQNYGKAFSNNNKSSLGCTTVKDYMTGTFRTSCY
jgi:hypothetical protein